MLRSMIGLLLCLIFSLAAMGQLPTATLNGTVTDPQGASVASAKVTITNQGTGVSRDTTTDAQGFYTFANMAPGDYTLRFEALSFATSEAKDVRLEVGRATTLDVKLVLAKVGQVVNVQIGEVQVDVTQSEVQGLVESQTIENIPLNGRNFLELAFLIPGNRPATNFDPTKTNTLEVSSAGAFGRGGNLTIDGGDNNDEVVGGTLANLPEDSVQEFQIATNKFTAEVGRSGSSIINIVTKSGTNNLHGSAFLFFRHKTLQGLPATFDRTQPTPSFAREQFGGSVGGALKKDRAWWFVSSEYRDQTHAVSVGQRDFTSNAVVSASAPAFLHDFLLNARTDFKLTDKDTLAVRYTFNRSLEIANGSLRKPQGTAANRQSSLNRFNSVLADWTRMISPRVINSLIFHADYFLNDMPAFSPDDPITNPAGLAAGNEVRFASLQDGANFRIPQSTKFNRYQLRDTLSWVLGNHTVRFGGEWQHLNTYALFDLFGSGTIYLTGNFGGDVCQAQAIPILLCDRNQDGVVDDRDIPIAVALKSAAPSRPPSVPFYPNAYFGTYVQDDWRLRSNFTVNMGIRWEFDDIVGDASNLRPCPTLTTADNTCEFAENILGTHSGKDLKQFGPRIGFAWDPLKHGETVVRGGYGIYYDRVVTEVPLLELLLNGRILPLAAFGGSTCHNFYGGGVIDCNATPAAGTIQPVFDTGTPTLLAPFSGGAAVFGIGVNHIDPKAKRPYVQQFTLGVQQMFAKNWLISADGLHNFGQRFIWGRLLRSTTSTSPNIVCTNGFDPCTITDPLTGRSDQVTNIESTAKSWYDALLLSLQKRPTGSANFRWGFNVNYTLSKTLNFSNDDQIPFNGAEDAVNLIFRSNNTRLEKGYAPTDERHRLVFFGVFEVPWKITLSPIWTMSSSVPMDSLVPALGTRLPILARNALGREITTGTQLNAAIAAWNALPVCSGVNQIPCHSGGMLNPVNPSLKFGSGFNSFDLRGTKTWTLFKEQKLQFITEVFNLFNVTNIRGTNNNNYSGYNNDITSARFNEARNTAGGFFGSGGPRAFQFALRYTF
ncbi:MAG: carboxypeptidase regulatory-like domain-containing protein [Acidobacteriia bacterium]|nr:carboxypeptidase regulatory-like domain-containing protein [Terriglobia bacterium]